MRKEAVRLAEAARALGLERTGAPAPRCVKIKVPPDTLPSRLLDLQVALEAFDAAGGFRQGDADVDIEKLRTAVDGVFRWIRRQGLSTDEPLALMIQAMGGKGKPRSSLDTMPRFSMNYKPRKPWKPKLGIDRSLEDGAAAVTLDDHKGQAWKMEQAAASLGHAAPKVRAEPEPTTPAGSFGR